MDKLELLKPLALLLIANGTPVIMARLLGDRMAWPVDFHRRFPDGNPIFGPSKTYGGLLSSLLATTLAAPLLGLPAVIGAKTATFAMLGDLSSSFTKRRLGLRPSAMALGLDQIPEALFPLLAVGSYFRLDAREIAALTIAFFALELILSRILYLFHIRRQPY